MHVSNLSKKELYPANLPNKIGILHFSMDDWLDAETLEQTEPTFLLHL